MATKERKKKEFKEFEELHEFKDNMLGALKLTGRSSAFVLVPLFC
jgi:hypothetical protein